MKSYALALIAVGLLAQPMAASAITVPAASGGESIAQLAQSGFGTLTWYEVPGASATALPGSASAIGGAGDEVTVAANSYYYFEVVGPAGTVPTVDISATTAATNSSYGTADATVVFDSSAYVAFACANDCPVTPPVLRNSFSVEVNSPFEVSLAATVFGPASALADPFISVDPSTPNASEYSIVVSDGVSNSPVPLPTSAWLMLSGLGGLVLLGRKRTA